MNCRSCGGGLVEVLDLGTQYLPDFRDDDQRPPRFPLNLMFCETCYLAQLETTVPRELMYHERYGFKSGVNDTIRGDLASVVSEALNVKPNASTWLDIASNDGTLLSFVPKHIRRVGVDPVKKYCDEAEAHADLVVNGYFDRSSFLRREFEVITSVSMFYDVDDPNEFVEDVKHVLRDDGVWVIQQNYLGATLDLGAVDNICHEHITYYSLLSLSALLGRHGLEVFRVSTSGINGGSFRTLVARKGVHPIHESVDAMVRQEIRSGLGLAAPFGEWGRWVNKNLRDLTRTVRDLNELGNTVYIYGASTRGGTLWQAAGLDVNDLPYAVDRNPEKVGKVIASIGTPIISEAQARLDSPDYMLVSPWFFRDEFMAREKDYLRDGGSFIFPLPEVEIVR